MKPCGICTLTPASPPGTIFMNVFTLYLKLVCATMFFNITTSNKLIEVY